MQNLVRPLVKKIPDEFITCRALGHAWKYFRVNNSKRRNKRHSTYDVELRCTRCPTERTVFLDKYGKLRGSVYWYPKGYLIEGLGRLTAEDNAYIRLRLYGIAV